MEDPTGKLRLYKCKGMASLYAPRMQALMARGPAPPASATAAATSNSCSCAATATFQAPVVKRKRLFPKKSEFPRNTVLEGWWGREIFTGLELPLCLLFCFSNGAAVACKASPKGPFIWDEDDQHFEVFHE